MKKAISVILCLSLAFAVASIACATMIKKSEAESSSSFSFIDGEGKQNTIITTIPKAGTSHVEHYIDGVLLNTADASLTGGDNISITVTDAATSETETTISPVSDFVSDNYSIIVPETGLRAYGYAGRINYNTVYDTLGTAYNYKLNISTSMKSNTYTYKTLNVARGAVISVLISAVAAVLTVIFPPLGVSATALINAAASAVGVTILGGIVQGAISKQYYVRLTPFDILAIDSASSRQRSYTGGRYILALDGGGWSSNSYYEGYMPWNSNAVAYLMYPDFWTDAYPGVVSYSYT